VKRILLTGARGFIGAHCLSKLAARGFEIHAVSSRPVAHKTSASVAVTHHQADLLDPCQVNALVDTVRPSHLLHLAWVVAPGEFWSSPLNWQWVNASLTLLRAFGVAGGERAVMIGSCAEYDPPDGRCIEGVTPLGSATLYGAAKGALSLMVPAVARQQRVESVAWARIFYLYGPGEAPTRLVPSVVRAILRGEPIACTHGEQVRDFLYIEDVAEALARLLESQVEGAVNVGSGQPTTIRELLSALGKEVGGEELLQFGALPADPTEPHTLVADVKRLRREVGWAPQVGLADGVRRTVHWWRQEMARES
jgi:nucleoside-diphosphate-sugar epimerase